MKREWRVRRQLQATTDAARRWDQAYQHLLGWTLASETVCYLPPPFRAPAETEIRYEDGHLCSGIDEPSDPGSNH
jgi:hypothetical protein